MSGKHSAVLGLMGVELAAPLGSAVIEGRKEVEIESHGEISIGAHHDVFMRSEHDGAYIHGGGRAYMGSGGSSGFGAVATEHYINIGKMNDGANLPAATADDDCSMKINAAARCASPIDAGFAHDSASTSICLTVSRASSRLSRAR